MSHGQPGAAPSQCKASEIVLDRVKCALARALVNRLEHLILADLRQALMLKPFLQLAHVDIANRAGQRACYAFASGRDRQLTQEDGRTLHLVEAEHVHSLRRGSEGYQHIRQVRKYPTAIILDRALQPISAIGRGAPLRLLRGTASCAAWPLGMFKRLKARIIIQDAAPRFAGQRFVALAGYEERDERAVLGRPRGSALQWLRPRVLRPRDARRG